MRAAVVALGLVWLAMPLLLVRSPGEDAVPIVIAGELIDDHPDQIYPRGELTEVGPTFRARVCDALATDGGCPRSAVGTAFLSPPTALPLGALLSIGGVGFGTLILRTIGAGAAAAGLALAWRDLAGRSELAPACVACAAVAMTPLVGYSVGLGQTSALLFLAAAAGAPGRGARGRLATFAWGVVTGLKAFPAIALVAMRRRAIVSVVVVAGIAAAFTAVGLMLAGVDRMGEFVRSTLDLAEGARSGQRSGGLESVADLVVDGDVPVEIVAWLLRLPLLLVVVRGARRGDDGVRWAAGLLGAVIVSPQVWTHYVIVLPGLGLALARARGAGTFAVASLATVPAVVAVGVASGTALTLVVAGTLAAAAIWAGRRDGPSPLTRAAR